MDSVPALPPAHPPVTASQHLASIDRRSTDRFPLAGAYTELVWGPLVGPVGILVARRLCLARLQPGDRSVDLHALAANLGVGNENGSDFVGSNHRIVVALSRAQHYGLIEWSRQRATIGVSGWAPEVPPRLLRRLPAEAEAHHRQMTGALTRGRTAAPPARPLALTTWPAPSRPGGGDQPSALPSQAGPRLADLRVGQRPRSK
jgi:hypothetical protein